MALVLRKTFLPRNASLLKCIKGRSLASAANKNTPAPLSNVEQKKRLKEQLKSVREVPIIRMKEVPVSKNEEAPQQSQKTARTVQTAHKSASCPNLSHGKLQEQTHEENQLLRHHSAIFYSEQNPQHTPMSIPLPFQSTFCPVPDVSFPNFCMDTQGNVAGSNNAVELARQLCSVCGCPSPCCACCGLPPPGCKPQCIQFMTGYYYYPYGFWFCGPYNICTGCCPTSGPVSPGGPCGPNPPKPCPCPCPCCLCPALPSATKDTKNAPAKVNSSEADKSVACFAGLQTPQDYHSAFMSYGSYPPCPNLQFPASTKTASKSETTAKTPNSPGNTPSSNAHSSYNTFGCMPPTPYEYSGNIPTGIDDLRSICCSGACCSLYGPCCGARLLGPCGLCRCGPCAPCYGALCRLGCNYFGYCNPAYCGCFPCNGGVCCLPRTGCGPYGFCGCGVGCCGCGPCGCGPCGFGCGPCGCGCGPCGCGCGPCGCGCGPCGGGCGPCGCGTCGCGPCGCGPCGPCGCGPCGCGCGCGPFCYGCGSCGFGCGNCGYGCCAGCGFSSCGSCYGCGTCGPYGYGCCTCGPCRPWCGPFFNCCCTPTPVSMLPDGSLPIQAFSPLQACMPQPCLPQPCMTHPCTPSSPSIFPPSTTTSESSSATASKTSKTLTAAILLSVPSIGQSASKGDINTELVRSHPMTNQKPTLHNKHKLTLFSEILLRYFSTSKQLGYYQNASPPNQKTPLNGHCCNWSFPQNYYKNLMDSCENCPAACKPKILLTKEERDRPYVPPLSFSYLNTPNFRKPYPPFGVNISLRQH